MLWMKELPKALSAKYATRANNPAPYIIEPTTAALMVRVTRFTSPE
jgi:hypothetical protein